jgi:hypothetical protein
MGIGIYFIGALSLIIIIFLIGVCVQLIRIEKSLTEISLLVENKVGDQYKAVE